MSTATWPWAVATTTAIVTSGHVAKRLCAQPESKREYADEHRLRRSGPVPDTMFYKGHCHTEATSRATGEPQCGHTYKWMFSLEKATETQMDQQMEVRGGGL